MKVIPSDPHLHLACLLASIAGKPIQQSVELPATARGGSTVLLVNENSRLERLTVELLRRERDRVWVRGIAAGQAWLLSK